MEGEARRPRSPNSEVARQGGNVLRNEDREGRHLGQITDALFNVGGQYRRNMWAAALPIIHKQVSFLCDLKYFEEHV